MARDRIIVGATADDATARGAARRLRDEGHEVVYVGGGQTAEQLVRTAVAEDATRLVVDADAATVRRIVELAQEAGVDDLEVGTAV